MDDKHRLSDAPRNIFQELRHFVAELNPTETSEAALELIDNLETQVTQWSTARHIENQDLREKLEQSKQMAFADPVTGLSNRRLFDQRLLEEWIKSVRTKAPLGLLLIDVDSFKAFNDSYGHAAGDACLRKIATVIKRAVDRPDDLPCRYGGDEFAVILPQTDEAGARRKADAIRSVIASSEFTERGTTRAFQVSVSVGVASMAGSRDFSQTDLISAADAALYRAKDLGRNAVVGGSNRDCQPRIVDPPALGCINKLSFKQLDQEIVCSSDHVQLVAEGKRFTGLVLAVDDHLMIQSVGRGKAVVHDFAKLSHKPVIGEMICVMYHKQRALVVDLILHRQHSRGYDR